MPEWETQPVLQVQRAAVAGEIDAIREMARRYAITVTFQPRRMHTQERADIARQWVRGWQGERDPYGEGRGGDDILRRAWQHGKNDHDNAAAGCGPLFPESAV